MLSDLRFALRQITKSPGFSAVAIILLALGIGANTAFFSVFKAQVMSLFPYPEVDRVVQLWRTNSTQLESNPWALPDFLDVRAQSTSFAEIGLYMPNRFNLGGEHSQVLQGVNCTPGVLRALGMQPALGRWFAEEDDEPGKPSIAVLSHACWIKNFGGDPAIVGRSIRLNAENYTVAGVMPAAFEFYCPWTGSTPIDLWTPLKKHSGSRGDHMYLAVGRLKSGVALEEANAEMKVISDRLGAQHPDTNYKKWFFGRPLRVELAARSMIFYSFVITAVVLVLIVASANVAIMFLARGAGRQVEYAVRLALGATRVQLVRLALTESLVYALLGSVVGVGLAWNFCSLLTVLFPPETTHAAAIQVDPTVLGFSMLLALVTSLVAGLPPAFTAARTQVVDTIKQGGLAQTTSRLRHRFLQHLVSSQIAVALLLANTTLLLLVSYRSAIVANHELSSESVLTAGIILNPSRYQDPEKRVALWNRLIERIKTLPSVTAVGMTTKLPLHGGYNSSILVDGETFDPKIRRPIVETSNVSPGYFQAMGIALLQGRTFDMATDAMRESLGVVINRTLANTYWPGKDPIGQRIRGDSPTPWFTATVVGVVEDVRQWQISRPALCEVYFPYGFDTRNVEHLVVRSAFDAHQMVPMIRRELALVDSDLALLEPQTMSELVERAGTPFKSILSILGFFMVATLVMAAIGIYGTLAFQTQQRTREIGVRAALGAVDRDIVALVLRQTTPWVVGGFTVGLLLSLAVGMLLRKAFSDVGLLNPLYFFAGAAVLAVVFAVACWLPALRAMRVNPIEALRTE
ncbi:MAG: ABC transporter permease [Nibricoccus sp.]